MSETKKLLTRADLAKADTWATEDLYATDALWEETLATLKADTAVLASYAGKLSNADDLYAYLTKTEEVHVKLGRLGNYSSRKADEDTRNTVYQAMNGEFMSEAVALSAATSFETPELVALSDEQMEALYAACPGLERYRRYLTDARRRKAHILSPAEEKLLAAAGEMADTPDNIFGAFTNADMTFPDAVDGKGEAHPLSSGNFVLYEESADRALRKSAYENLYHTYAASKNTSAALLNGQAKVLKFNSDARKYPFSLDAALDATNVPTSVYYNLIEAVHQNLDKMHRYVRLRKKLLGVDELHFYDIYTPLVAGVDRHISIDEAKKTVYDALYPLGEDYRKVLKSGFENRWIDVYPNVGKRSGAYSAGADIHPYVLLNYTGTLDNQFTLAHEMGHAMHSYYSNHTQPFIKSDYTIFVAEVASTCNEVLTINALRKKFAGNQAAQQALIGRLLEGFRTTVFRQTMFAEFEMKAHAMEEAGQPLTRESLNAMYYDLNKQYYGGGCRVDKVVENEWMRIPHFYRSFYVYKYATSFCAAVALADKILHGTPEDVAAYRRFLTLGGSMSPIEELKTVGIDMSTPAPIEAALDVFASLLADFQQQG